MTHIGIKQRIRQYGLFTPEGIAAALEHARTLPVPKDARTVKDLGFPVREGWVRITVDLPTGVAWRASKLWKARGISRTRFYQEILTFYIVAVAEEVALGAPALYADFATPEGIAVLTRAMTLAWEKMGEDARKALEAEARVDVAKAHAEDPVSRAIIGQSIQLEQRRATIEANTPPPPSEFTPEEREELSEW